MSRPAIAIAVRGALVDFLAEVEQDLISATAVLQDLVKGYQVHHQQSEM
jgi:hypothetical protein